jgi:hypothetical protein
MDTSPETSPIGYTRKHILWWYRVELTDDGTTILVGASHHDTGGTDTGRAYIFDKAANGTWSQTQILRASNGGASDYFASSIGISGDGTVICCGAYNEDTGATNKGAAYIFVKSAAGAWSQTETQFIQASDGTTSDSFGLGVSVSQNGDRILVGSHLDDTGEGDSGSMYIFDRTNGVWTQTTTPYARASHRPQDGYGTVCQPFPVMVKCIWLGVQMTKQRVAVIMVRSLSMMKKVI